MRWVLCTWIALAPFWAAAQSRETNPYTLRDKAALAKGRQLYSFYCVFCHGMDGASGRGAQLASTYRKHGSSDRELFRTIADGVPGTEMSGHWIEEDEIWQIVLFVRQFEQNAASGARACQVNSGDAAQGAALFQQNCRNCHHAASRLGPDLAGIGTTRSRDHLRESIVEPGKAISRAYRTVRVRTAQGQVVRGLLLNQDEYTVHLLDGREQVRSFARSQLTESAVTADSFMPSFANALTAAQLDHLLAYLCTGGSRP